MNLNEKLVCFTVADLKSEVEEFLNRKITAEEFKKIYDKFFEIAGDMILDEEFVNVCKRATLEALNDHE